jgi:hypothetical protein
VRHGQHGAEERLPGQLAMLVLTAISGVAVVLALPVEESTRGALLSLIGVVLSAALALSSTTFIANAMAGLLLRIVGSFHPGDFIKVADYFGRVTERGLFHTEIQTEDRDLETIPNLFLLQNPIRVVRTSGTIVSATVSLGYDVPHGRAEKILVEAAGEAGLADGFVQVAELGNYAVTYRVAGFLAEVTHLLTARSQLRQAMLDALHGAEIEIVSPTFMNQRQLDATSPVVPAARAAAPVEEPPTVPEDVMFDKAEEAGRVETLRREVETLGKEIRTAESRAREASDAERPALERELERLRARREAAEHEVEALRERARED